MTKYARHAIALGACLATQALFAAQPAEPAFDAELLAFIADCERHTGVSLEALYTGKALLALREQVEAGLFAPGTRLIVVHTGGLQGRRGYL